MSISINITTPPFGIGSDVVFVATPDSQLHGAVGTVVEEDHARIVVRFEAPLGLQEVHECEIRHLHKFRANDQVATWARVPNTPWKRILCFGTVVMGQSDDSAFGYYVRWEGAARTVKVPGSKLMHRAIHTRRCVTMGQAALLDPAIRDHAIRKPTKSGRFSSPGADTRNMPRSSTRFVASREEVDTRGNIEKQADAQAHLAHEEKALTKALDAFDEAALELERTKRLVKMDSSNHERVHAVEKAIVAYRTTKNRLLAALREDPTP